MRVSRNQGFEIRLLRASKSHAQIADLVLEHRCQRAIFFESPHVERQHEADIQQLERAVTTVIDTAVCITTPRVAARWAEAAELRRNRRVGG